MGAENGRPFVPASSSLSSHVSAEVLLLLRRKTACSGYEQADPASESTLGLPLASSSWP